MGYALDGIILGICLLCVLIGVQRGFIRSVVHFLGAVIAACLASALGGVVAQWLFDSLFRQAMVEKISDSLQGLGAENAAAAVEQIIASLPDFLVRALEEAGVTAASITGGIGVQTGQAAQLITDYLSPVFVNFLKVLVVIVLFSLFMTLVRILAGVVSRMLRLPIIHQLDGLLGGIFGFLLAMVSVWIVVAALLVFMPMLDEGMQQQINGALDSSFLAGTLIRLNPLRGLFS
ncbi:CvpA family protein [Acutalibacter sp. 1XD8-33]|uniref:CvpA family protein n=1 Tax=Acutalibacter sp. 1XD8-33 TaxID=2320081 RepID=UPI000EA33008|nr:CvpA family protein [Acutalibacter sp. 1XD8-33]RKJ40274.1 CvpA family protein [Acutalibacter sp. 1XD8-33]